MRPVGAFAACAWAVALLGSAEARADGDVIDQCVQANTQAQALRHAGKLAAARQQLQRCIAPACPELVRGDCTQLLDDLDRAQPTIVFDVKDETGRDLTDVDVQMDGRPFASHLGGVALAADPGQHAVVLSAAGRIPVTEEIVINEGEKSRRESVVLRSVDAPPEEAPASVPARSAPAVASAGLGAPRFVALVLGGVGIVALGVGGALAFGAQAKNDDANRFCPTMACANADALSINREAVGWANAASAVLVGGAAALVAGGVLWLSGKPSSRTGVAVRVAGSFVSVGGAW